MRQFSNECIGLNFKPRVKNLNGRINVLQNVLTNHALIKTLFTPQAKLLKDICVFLLGFQMARTIQAASVQTPIYALS